VVNRDDTPYRDEAPNRYRSLAIHHEGTKATKNSIAAGDP